MIVVTGLSVTERTWSMIRWPQLASLVSTITTPFDVTNAAVLPPPPLITNRLSFSFSIVATCGCAACPPRRRRLLRRDPDGANGQQHSKQYCTSHSVLIASSSQLPAYCTTRHQSSTRPETREP